MQARVDAWPLAAHRQRHPLLLPLLAAPQGSSEALAQSAGQQRAAARILARLYGLGLTDWEYRGLVRYHWLRPATEDALLLVVAGPSATP